MLFKQCSFDTLFQLFSTISVKGSSWNLFFLSISYLSEKFHSDLISRIICNVCFLLAKYWLMSAGSTNRKMVLAKLRPVMSS